MDMKRHVCFHILKKILCNSDLLGVKQETRQFLRVGMFSKLFIISKYFPQILTNLLKQSSIYNVVFVCFNCVSLYRLQISLCTNEKENWSFIVWQKKSRMVKYKII